MVGVRWRVACQDARMSALGDLILIYREGKA